MPEVTTCPKCDKKLKVPDNLIGKKVRCPGCEDTFTAQADGSADEGYEEPEEESAPRKVKAGAVRKDSISDRKGSPSRRDEDEDNRPRAEKSRGEDEDDRPRKKSREEEDDRPREKSRDEDEEDDRPRKKSRDDEDDRDRDRSRGVKRSEDFDDRPSRSRRDDDDRDRDRDRRDDRPSRSRRDDYDEDHDRGRSRGGSAEKGWRGTRVGVFLMVISNWTQLAAIGIGFIGFGLMMFFGATMLANVMGGFGGDNRAGFGAAAGMGVMLIIFVGLLGLLWFAHGVLDLVGMGLCMQVPPLRGTALKPMAIAAFACGAAAFLFSLINQTVAHHNAVGSFSGLLSLASFICWIIFLRMVSNELGDSDLGSKFLMYMITYFVFVVVAVLVVIIAACTGGAALAGSRDANQAATGVGVMMVIMMILGFVILAIYLGLLVWYSLLMQRLRGVITRHLERG